MRDRARTASCAVIVVLLLVMRCAADGFDGFANETLRERRYEALYAQYYTNLAQVQFVPSSARMRGVDAVVASYGAGAATSAVNASALVLVQPRTTDAQDWARLCAWDDAQAAHVWDDVVRSASAPDTDGVALVLAPDDGVQFDVRCLFRGLGAYNAAATTTVRVVLLRDVDVTRAVDLRVDEVALELLDVPLGLIPLFYPAVADAEWASVVRAAQYNARRGQRGRPRYVVEYRARMALRARSSSESDSNAATCLCGGTACAPMAGWTVWGGTGPIAVSWDDKTQRFRKLTRPHTAALLVPATTVAHGAAPGADSPGSGLVAALAIAEVVRRAVPGLDLYVFLLPAQHRGGVGAARLVHDTMRWTRCPGNGTLAACRELAYGDALEFTSVDLAQVETVIALDQVGYAAAPLFFHVDDRLQRAPGAALRQAMARLQAHNATRATTRRLPSSPVTAVLDLLWCASGKPGCDGVVALTVSRYDAVYRNPHVFTDHDTVTGKAVGGDAAPVLTVNAIETAANAVLHVLTGRDDLRVNATWMAQMWHCVTTFDCVPDAGAAVRPDFQTRVWHDALRPHERLLMRALESIGLQPYTAPAVPPGLEIETTYGPCWHQSTTWQPPEDVSDYDVYVVSNYGPADVGARLGMLGAHAVSLWTLLLGVGVTLWVVVLACSLGTPRDGAVRR